MNGLKPSLTRLIISLGIVLTLNGAFLTSSASAASVGLSFFPACPSGMVGVTAPSPGAQPRGRCEVNFGPFGLHLLFNLYQTPQRFEGVLLR